MSRELIYSLEPSPARCASTYGGNEIETKDDRKGRGLDQERSLSLKVDLEGVQLTLAKLLESSGLRRSDAQGTQS